MINNLALNTNGLFRFIYKIRLILLCVLVFGICNVSLLAAADTKVYDYANLFTLDEVETLEDSAKKLAEAYQMDIGIVTTNNAEGKSAMEYADDFYDNNDYGYGSNADGLLFLIDMDNREIYISTCGSGIQYFTDLRISEMLDSTYEYVSNANYYGAATQFLKDVQTNIYKGIPSNQNTVEKEYSDPRVDYNAPSNPHQPFTTPAGEPLTARSIGLSAIVAALVASLIAFITRSIVQYSYKHPRYTTPATNPDDLSVHYTEKEDRFVTTHTSRVKIQSNNNGGGGSGGSGHSSIHSSSGGHSHGGGGRGF